MLWEPGEGAQKRVGVVVLLLVCWLCSVEGVSVGGLGLRVLMLAVCRYPARGSGCWCCLPGPEGRSRRVWVAAVVEAVGIRATELGFGARTYVVLFRVGSVRAVR